MRPEMTSKERMLGAIDYRELDYIPCAFMIFYNLTNKFKKQDKAIEEELKMGLDAIVNVGTLEHSFHQDTKYSGSRKPMVINTFTGSWRLLKDL